MMKVKEVEIAKEVIRSDGWWRIACGDVWKLGFGMLLKVLPRIASWRLSARAQSCTWIHLATLVDNAPVWINPFLFINCLPTELHTRFWLICIHIKSSPKCRLHQTHWNFYLSDSPTDFIEWVGEPIIRQCGFTRDKRPNLEEKSHTRLVLSYQKTRLRSKVTQTRVQGVHDSVLASCLPHWLPCINHCKQRKAVKHWIPPQILFKDDPLWG